MNLAPVLRQRYLDANGAPLAGGLLYSYSAGTTTPQATYSNSTGTTNTNPVVLDSQGYADVWLDPTLAYKLVLKDSGGNQLWSADNVIAPSTGMSKWSVNTNYAQGEIVEDSSGQGLLYVSLISNNTANALTNTSAWRVFGGNVRTVSGSSVLAVTDDLVRSNSTSGSLTHTLPACATTPIGKRITIKDVGTSGNTTTIKGSGTDTIDGANSYANVLVKNEAATFENNGSSWDALTGVPTDGTVSTAKLVDGAVTKAKIASPIGTVNAFTSSGSYTVPANANLIQILAVGGGGGGGSGNSGTTLAGGGGAGSLPVIRTVPVTPGTALTMTIGAGGAGGTGGGSGSAGGDTTVVGTGVSVTVKGGFPGQGGASASPAGSVVGDGGYGPVPGGLAGTNTQVGSPGHHSPWAAGGTDGSGALQAGGGGGGGYSAGGAGGAGGAGSSAAANSGAGGGGGSSSGGNFAGGAGGSGYAEITVIG